MRALLLLAFGTLLTALQLAGQTPMHNEQWISSLRGKEEPRAIAEGRRLRVHDPEANFILAEPNTFSARLDRRRSEATVVLRFDDTRRDLYTTPWSVTVTYTLLTRQYDGTVINHAPEQLTVNYDPANPYTDISMHVERDVIWASLKVAQVVQTGLPAGLPKDLWLDLRLDVERHYDLGPNEAPQFTEAPATLPNDPSHLMLHWSFVEGAESYDLEWAFVDCITFNGSNAPVPCSPNGLTYDLSNATRVNVTGNRYEVPLAYPRGWLVFRVRAVGRTGPNGVREEGPWDLMAQSQPNIGTLPTFNRYMVGGLELERNWTYEAGYAEDGLRKEVLSTFDGSLRPRQSMTLLNTEGRGLLTNTVFDHLGRPALSVLPYPIEDRQLSFKTDQLQLAPNSYFGAASFDLDTNVDNPAPLPGTTPAGAYYSSANPGMGTHGQLTPDASGKPYTRTLFWNDGTGRVREEAGPGPEHTMGSEHTTRHAYGTPASQFELDRLFGNEVGYVQHYKKNTVTDANGVTSVTYQDQEGRTIATALAGFPQGGEALLGVDSYSQENVEVDVTAPLTSQSGPDNSSMVNRTMVFSTPTTLTLNYALEGAAYTDCITTPCVYELSIRVLDDCGTPLELEPGVTHYTQVVNGVQPAETFQLTLQPGTYTIQKVLRPHGPTLDAAMQAYMDEACIPAPEPEVVDCGDCASLCEQGYTIELEGVLYYTDATGLPTSAVDPNDPNHNAAAAQVAIDAIAQCVEDCGAPEQTLPDRCTMMHGLLLADMSPGGQYFKNTPQEMEEPYDPLSWDDWLVDEVAATPAGIIANQSTWTSVRDNWDPAWAELLLPYHPEYCQYQFYCESKCIEYAPGDIPISSTTIPFYGTYYDLMYSVPLEDQFDVTASLFNPLGAPVNTSSTAPYYQCASAAGPLDELIDCFKDCKDLILPGLSHFMPRDPALPSAGYYSIWEVLNDPDGIAGAHGGNGTVPQEIRDFFNLLHGATPNTPGILATGLPVGEGQMTPYAFFRSVYDFYRELTAYRSFTDADGQIDCMPEHTCNNLLTSPNNDGLTEDGFLIRYPRNPIFDNWDEYVNDPTYFSTTLIPGLTNEACADNCAAAAQQQLDALTMCTGGNTTGCYQEQDIACILQALTAVCQLGCTAENIQGSSLGNGTGSVTGTTPCNNTTTYATFQEVLDAYIINAPTAITYPVEPPSTGEPDASASATCACTGLQEFIAAQGPNASPADIMEALEELRGGSESGDTWSEGSTTTLAYWQQLCSATPLNPTLINAAAFPSAFHCPTISQEPYDCGADATAIANYNATQAWQTELSAAAQAYRTALAEACMSGLAEREDFTISYTLSEYHYTLYYYDQAGNLLKTVPPAGVRLDLATDYTNDANAVISFTGTTAVEDFSAATMAHRATPNNAATPYLRPRHELVTWYTYNSFQQPVAQHYPDGGTTRFFYDKLGRLIASQDPVQATAGHYSYTLYDALGRVQEVGQLLSPTPLNQEIARGEGAGNIPTWPAFLAQITAKDQIMRTYYTDDLATVDPSLAGVPASFGAGGQQHLRNRVASVTYKEAVTTTDPAVDDYDQATHYSYDIHGNVRSLVQELRELQEMGQSFKRMDYRYDLISGKVLEVNYQTGQWDQYHHRYRYDADGRLLEARTSNDGRVWERDARYFYYAHGPLARTELGDKSVQGTDHYYTLHGWLRGVNSPTLQRAKDPGKDGAGQHLFFADDANSYALGYYTGDFVPVAGNSASPLPANGSGAYAAALAQRDLYNGNIPTMLTALRDLSGAPMPLHANVYRYDRLNRIKGMDVYHGAPATDLSALANNDDYRTAYSYDPNGNILALERNAHGSNRDMDRFEYHYTAGTNQLDYVYDSQPAANWPDDLDEQDLGNYEYDPKGRLTKDMLAGIGEDGIAWTLHDKVRAVTRETTSDLDELHFRYGPMGHRTVKEVRPRTGGNTTQEDQWTTTYYIHDAQGNPMAIYRRSYQPTQGGNYRDQLVADGLPVYGSARLGMNQRPSLYRPEFSTTGFDGLHFAGRSYTQMPSPWVADDHADRTLGHKAYELANHLGNVLTTVSDRRMAVPDAGNPSLLEGYMADVRSVSDYYPFGSLLPGRNYSSDRYRFAFNGKENDNEVYNVTATFQDYGMRAYDLRIGRFPSVDPITAKYPMLTPYQFASNTPIQAVDIDGLEAGFVQLSGRGTLPLLKLAGVTLAVSIGIAFDREKMGVFHTFSIGGSYGTMVSMGVSVGAYPTVSSITDLKGFGFTLGTTYASGKHDGTVEANFSLLSSKSDLIEVLQDPATKIKAGVTWGIPQAGTGYTEGDAKYADLTLTNFDDDMVFEYDDLYGALDKAIQMVEERLRSITGMGLSELGVDRNNLFESGMTAFGEAGLINLLPTFEVVGDAPCQEICP
jgi:RHS repeat-associated protein